MDSFFQSFNPFRQQQTLVFLVCDDISSWRFGYFTISCCRLTVVEWAQLQFVLCDAWSYHWAFIIGWSITVDSTPTVDEPPSTISSNTTIHIFKYMFYFRWTWLRQKDSRLGPYKRNSHFEINSGNGWFGIRNDTVGSPADKAGRKSLVLPLEPSSVVLAKAFARSAQFQELLLRLKSSAGYH